MLRRGRGDDSLVALTNAVERQRVALLRLRSSEWVLLVYFTYTALLSVSFGLDFWRIALALAVPVLLLAMAWADEWYGRDSTSIVRDWVSVPLVLAAYWQTDWFQSGRRLLSLEESWLDWDRTILYQWGLRAVVERLALPSLLEASYTLLYSIPPLSVAAIYWYRRRDRLDRFLFPFLVGTLLAYGLLPYFPTESPYLQFPGQDLPSAMTIFRRLNLWILAKGDIHTSVFPSGHVAIAFSAAFSMLWAIPERKRLGYALLVLAVLIATATVYGRYHYAADVLASFLLSLAAIAIAQVVHRG